MKRIKSLLENYLNPLQERESRVGFLTSWLITRNGRDLLFATPALLSAMVLGLFWLYAARPVKQTSLDANCELAMQATERGESQLASIYARKALLQVRIPGGAVYEVLPAALRNFAIVYL